MNAEGQATSGDGRINGRQTTKDQPVNQAAIGQSGSQSIKHSTTKTEQEEPKTSK